MGFLEGFAAVVERVFDRLRPNVLLVALLVTWLIMDFGDKLIALLTKEVDAEIIVPVLTGLIGTGIGGLIMAMSRMFENPGVPADVHERVVRELTKSKGGGLADGSTRFNRPVDHDQRRGFVGAHYQRGDQSRPPTPRSRPRSAMNGWNTKAA